MRPDPRRSVHQPARMPPLPPTSSDPPAYSTNVSWASSGIFPTCMQAWRPVPDGSCEAHCLLVWHSTPAQYIHPSRTPHPTSTMGDRQVVRPLACENSTTLQQRFALSIHGTYRLLDVSEGKGSNGTRATPDQVHKGRAQNTHERHLPWLGSQE